MKTARLELDIDTEKAVATIREKIAELIKEQEDIIKEKIAFALFIAHYYKQRLQLEKDTYLKEMMLKELKDVWILGKQKNKLSFFFELANEIFNMDLNDNKIKKER